MFRDLFAMIGRIIERCNQNDNHAVSPESPFFEAGALARKTSGRRGFLRHPRFYVNRFVASTQLIRQRDYAKNDYQN